MNSVRFCIKNVILGTSGMLHGCHCVLVRGRILTTDVPFIRTPNFSGSILMVQSRVLSFFNCWELITPYFVLCLCICLQSNTTQCLFYWSHFCLGMFSSILNLRHDFLKLSPCFILSPPPYLFIRLAYAIISVFHLSHSLFLRNWIFSREFWIPGSAS